jgi:hypothetical protein
MPMPTAVIELNGSWKLPPLILHPFADTGAPERLLESSRAGLALHGLVPDTEFASDELDWKVLRGRYSEVQMLYYIGKDLVRWIDQCIEFLERDAVLRDLGVCPESLACLLVEDPPAAVKDKLRNWGVDDYRAIFSRAIGLYWSFGKVPERDTLSSHFLRHYYQFADFLFACRQQLVPFPTIRSANFPFELYASGEFARMLEKQWDS